MTPIASTSPATAPHATTAIPAPRSAHPRTGPLRSGNPRGNPNLAPRCGAKARTTGCSCQAPAMPNGRCRMHGGKSTGPRTPAGFASLARAHTTHGLYAQSGPEAELRAEIHHARVTVRRVRLNGAAFDLLPWLPPAFAARLRADTATELHAPPRFAKPPTAPAATPKPTDHPPATATRPSTTHTRAETRAENSPRRRHAHCAGARPSARRPAPRRPHSPRGGWRSSRPASPCATLKSPKVQNCEPSLWRPARKTPHQPPPAPGCKTHDSRIPESTL